MLGARVRARLLVAAGALRPSDRDRDAALAGVGHHVSRAPEPARRLAVPHRHQHAGAVRHHPTTALADLLALAPAELAAQVNWRATS